MLGAANDRPGRYPLMFRAPSIFFAALALLSCNNSGTTTIAGPVPDYRADPFLDTLETRTFNWFWETTNSTNGLVPDRWPTKSFSSVAAIGFGLTAYPIGVDRGYVSRADAAQRVRTTLDFLYHAPQGPGATAVTGYKGFFYHFLDMDTGLRFQTVELSTIDTALLLAGVLVCREYFTGADPNETAIRALGRVPSSSFILPQAFAYHTLDLRLRKDFVDVGGNRVGVTIEAFNFYNTRNMGCYSDFAGSFDNNGVFSPNATFGQPTCTIADPRRVQIGVSYDFGPRLGVR
jgi:hypothetical protein